MARMAAVDELAYYAEAKTKRSSRENGFRMASQYCLPEHYGAWQTEGPALVNGMQTVRRVVFDSTGMRSLPKYMSVLQRLATPDGQRYQTLTASNSYLMQSVAVRNYFESVTDLMFKYRQNSRARFRIAASEVYASIGAYGTGPIFVGKRRPNAVYPYPSMMYKGIMLRDIFILVDDNDEVHVVFRRFYLNKRMFMAKFPKATLPKCFHVDGPKAESVVEEFVHVVRVRSEGADPQALDARRHPVSASYINVKDQEYVEDEEGFQSIPYLTPRTFTVSGDPYGFSPAERVMSALGGASQMKKTQMKQGQKAVDPVLLTYDDGVMNGEVDLRPGAINPGGLDAQGRMLIQTLPSGDFRVSEKLLEDDRADIEDSFFVTLFQILNDTPEMTATEVIERVAEKTSLTSPTMGRLQTEFLEPCTEREIHCLTEMGLMPKMPPELVEAEGEYSIQYTSPQARNIHAEESAGFVRTVELTLNIVSQTGDPSPLDHFDLDKAIPELAYNQGAPARWMKDMKAVEAVRTQRAADMEKQQLIQNAGGLAQVAKAAGEMEQPKGKRGL